MSEVAGKLGGGLLVVVFVLSVLVGPGGALAVAMWPLGVGPFSSAGRACVQANTVATQLNTLPAIKNPEQARRQAEEAALAMRALARVVRGEPEHGQFLGLAEGFSALVSSADAGDLAGLAEASAAIDAGVGQVNRWYAQACGSWTIRLPIWLNQVFAGGIPTFV